MANALGGAPVHKWEQLEGFGDVREDDHDEAARTKELEEVPHGPTSREGDCRPDNERAYRHQRD